MTEIIASSSTGNLKQTNEISIQVDSDGLLDFYQNSKCQEGKYIKPKHRYSISNKHTSRNSQSQPKLINSGHKSSIYNNDITERSSKYEDPSPKIKKYLHSRTKTKDSIIKTQTNSNRDSLIIRKKNTSVSTKYLFRNKIPIQLFPSYKIPPAINPIQNFAAKLIAKPSVIKLKKNIELNKNMQIFAKKSKSNDRKTRVPKLIDLNELKLKIYGL